MAEKIVGDDTSELREEVARLRRQLDELTARVQAAETPADNGVVRLDERTDRRQLFKAAGAAALGATVVGLADALPAGAATGDNMIVGQSNSATSTTSVTTTTGEGLFGSTSDASGAGVYGQDTSTGGTAGLYGISANGYGVYGQITGATTAHAAMFGNDQSTSTGGYGIYAQSHNGWGARFKGALAPLLLDLASSAGAPTSGAHVAGEVYVDSNAVFYRCIGSGTPGVWVPIYAVVPLVASQRVIDTTTGTGGLAGAIAPDGTTHTVGPIIGGGTNVPSSAIGLVGNLAISAESGLLNGDGYLTLFPAGTSNPGTASITSGAGCFATSNGVTFMLGAQGTANAGKVALSWQGGGAPPHCQVFFDVTAYIL